jgi:hypothetical protein
MVASFGNCLTGALPILLLTRAAAAAPATFSCGSDAPGAPYCIETNITEGNTLLKESHATLAGATVRGNWAGTAGTLKTMVNGLLQTQQITAASPGPQNSFTANNDSVEILSLQTTLASSAVITLNYIASLALGQSSQNESTSLGLRGEMSESSSLTISGSTISMNLSTSYGTITSLSYGCTIAGATVIPSALTGSGTFTDPFKYSCGYGINLSFNVSPHQPASPQKTIEVQGASHNVLVLASGLATSQAQLCSVTIPDGTSLDFTKFQTKNGPNGPLDPSGKAITLSVGLRKLPIYFQSMAPACPHT